MNYIFVGRNAAIWPRYFIGRARQNRISLRSTCKDWAEFKASLKGIDLAALSAKLSDFISTGSAAFQPLTDPTNITKEQNTTMETISIAFGNADLVNDVVQIATLDDLSNLPALAERTLTERMATGEHTHATLQLHVPYRTDRPPLTVELFEWVRRQGKLIGAPVPDASTEIRRTLAYALSA